MQGLTIYKSSAGSGKTFTLVKEYLKLVLKNPSEFRQILAITFTNKATDEMKNRIIKALVELSENRNPHLSKILEEEATIGGDIPSRASEVLDKILHDYSGFSISTIDSFFNRIIKSLAKEMHLPLRFDIEMNQENVIADLSDRLLAEIGNDPELTVWLEKLMFFKLEDDKGWKLEADIHKIAKELFKERNLKEGTTHLADIEAFTTELAQIKKSFEDEMSRIGKEGITLLERNSLGLEDFSYGKAGGAGYFYKVCKKGKPENYKPGSRTLDVLENPDKWIPSKSFKKDVLYNVITQSGGLQEKVAEANELYNQKAILYYSIIEVLKLAYIYGIFNFLKNKLRDYRDEKNLVMMSDTTQLLKEFITQSDAPFVFEKIGNRYKHFLIDEFQDTSDVQWENIFPLVENSMANGNFTMIVGDAKQSIYRWRGGNMNLLLSDVQTDLTAFREILKEEVLKVNYRSKQTIVEFNNDFFQKSASLFKETLKTNNLIFEDAYSETKLKQEFAEKNKDGGLVRIEFLSESSSQEESVEEAPDEVHWKELALKRLLSTIKQLEGDGYQLRDIAILIRKNSEGNEVSSFLFENGYNRVISSESLLLWKSPVIRFLLNIMQFLSNPDDVVARSAALTWYIQFRGITTDPALVFTDHKAAYEESILQEVFPLKFLENKERLARSPLYQLTEQLIMVFGLNEVPDAYIQRFQDLILEFSSKDKPDLRTFLEWYHENGESDVTSVIIPETENAIRIISVHKSKGLQYPVVIMPFCDWKLLPNPKDIIWVSSSESPFNASISLPVNPTKNLTETFFSEAYSNELVQNYIDNLNILYVAFTRPEDRLYVFTPLSDESKLTCVSSLLFQTLSGNENFDAVNHVFQKGEAGKVSESSIEPESEKLENYPITEWESRLRLSHNSIFEVMGLSEKNEKVKFGLLVHDVLSRIITPGDSEKILDEMIFKGIISEEEKVILGNQLKEIFSVPETVNWFSPHWKVINETEIMLPEGGVVRPDRVLVNGKNAILVDYKTGNYEKKHEQQVIKYRNILREMGFNEVEGYLFYVSDLKVLKVD